MIGLRTRIVLLTMFFTFAFSMMFLALVENYAQANDTPTVPIHSAAVVSTADIQAVMDYQIIPDFGQAKTIEPSFDFDSDDSLQKFLHTNHPFNDISYVPVDLVPINSDFTANNARAFKLREEAAFWFANMAWHFWNAFSGDRLYIFSAYRSKSYQSYLLSKGCTSVQCAIPGTSEHQAGLAVDLRVVTKGGKVYTLDVLSSNKYYNWLKTHAARFGFHNTYQKGIEVDGKIPEGRHWRYLGTGLAKILADSGQTFAEYYFNMMKDERGMMNDK